ncbi:hypothetical protein M9H77_31049 [Catharanthus roseus]|uniref:Uncharacterized protein n=1 Tax=Catharanthus roseus TaxID=4058 RepID=A0ACB9ZYZ2_CATRO|nr:hypothetical protein M9H77_31049 [Catharanthus roseus]
MLPDFSGNLVHVHYLSLLEDINAIRTYSWVQLSRRRPREHVLDWGACGVKKDARRQPGCGAGGGRPPVPHFPGRPKHADSRHVEIERRTLHTPPPPGLGFVPFQSPTDTSLGFLSFCAPPPPGIASSSRLHQPISQAPSSDDEELTDDTDDVQHLGFRHRVGKNTMRFTPCDWP